MCVVIVPLDGTITFSQGHCCVVFMNHLRSARSIRHFTGPVKTVLCTLCGGANEKFSNLNSWEYVQRSLTCVHSAGVCVCCVHTAFSFFVLNVFKLNTVE